MLTEDLLQKALTKEYWLSLCPDLSITDNLLEQDREAPYEIDPTSVNRCTEQFNEEGYLHTDPIIPKVLARKLADAIIKVTEQGFPAQFCLVYDDFWHPLMRLNNLLEPIIGKDYLLLPDFWFYHIPNTNEGSGWAAQRDVQFPNPFDTNGRPNVLNLWIPLTDATPLNGCMYILPKSRDPDYPKDFSNLIGHDLSEDKPSPSTLLQNYRALPAKAGSILGWGQYVYHWGSRSSKWAPEPRINYSMYVQRADVAPYDDLAINLSGNNNFELSFNLRVGIVCRSLWQYRNTNSLSFDQDLLEFAKNNHSLLGGRGYQKLNISRNDPCWCGSGKRFKHCHGART